MKRIKILFAFLAYATFSFAQTLQNVPYQLPDGTTLHFALEEDGTAILTNSSGSTWNPDYGGGVAEALDFEHFIQDCWWINYQNAYDDGSCHYYNQHASTYSGVCKDIVIPDTITFSSNGASFRVVKIARNAFKHADWLRSIVIPKTVYFIDRGAFLHCRNLEKVIIGDSLEYDSPTSSGPIMPLTIEDYAFACCYNLRKVILRSCSLGTACFFNDEIDTVIMNGNCLFTPIYNVYLQTPYSDYTEMAPFHHQGANVGIDSNYRNVLTTLIIGDSVKVMTCPISTNFGGDTMTFPNGLRKIGIWNSSHYNINLPDSLKEFICICLPNVTEITIPDGMRTKIRFYLADHCSSSSSTSSFPNFIGSPILRKLTIGKNIYEIGTCPSDDELWRFDTIIIRSRKITSMSRASFPSHYVNITVPCGKLADYQSMVGMTAVNLNMHEDTNCHVIVVAQSENEQYGSVSGGGAYQVNTSVTISATPNSGFIFQRWSNGSTSNPLTFQVVDDTIITAFFEPLAETQYTITVISNDEMMGSVSGGGTFNEGSTISIVANANSGYHFDHWQDNNRENPRIITVTGNKTYTAYFAEGQNDIDDISNGGIIIHSNDGRIVVEGTSDEVNVYDMTGRIVRNENLPAGVYMVKVGNLPARKVVVMR